MVTIITSFKEKVMDLQLSLRLALAHKNVRAIWLAEKVGVSKSHMSGIMNNKKVPPITLVEKLAKALGYKTSELIALGEE